MHLTDELYQRIVNAKLYMDVHYHENIHLSQIARQACLSRFHFHRLFTHIYKKTPHRYLTQLRLDAARVLLAREGIRIADVCTQIGFESLASFSSLFRRENGFSPQYYRNIAWLKKKLEKEQPKKFIPHCFAQQYGVYQ
jgi:AraC-like DNA-binding protein